MSETAIPEDVMQAAAQTCRDTDYSPTNFDGTPSTVCKAIARGMLGERERHGWQPIDTAPTDYTEVIGIDASGNVARTWFFAPSSRSQYWLKRPRNAKWKPTHWMPIPSAPEVSA